MSSMDGEGMLISSKVEHRRFQTIEQGDLRSVSALVVHQTDAPTAEHTFNGYRSKGSGAHFLIEKNGVIYQTASMKKRCFHVGRYIRSKCMAVDKASCDTAQMAKIHTLSWTLQIRALDRHERTKNYPERYPMNSDSLGIELVGKHLDAARYEAITAMQTQSLQWLVSELFGHYGLASADFYTHPQISYKHPGEASSAVWQ
ncbi:N-acetylmuramoyl-L-alanine amidase [Pseudomonas tolaasii]|uniref:N-acetylmuramoyl-L-alanine amidase n=2 Tax=Pseudomonas tolaasii TaxID=29442 RepID=A0A7Y8AK69_PSETO|nr:peptidoglycan recognition family protein [Pseudomonas tolaasii]ARB27890.1 N-acetylmuramoyl-L-alanine amidase [Pseudomonas tolaasii]KAB0477844.1 N-acetylmuramoyl-L-alanine amidase [Pseudomonas tolaasii]MBY8940302.1 N-acetylmuramoyl-L-alanine amidase [Pseudomonas tolaasii]NWC20590.1 N-acetylmuramoyl-L-alanine amidase [Pseudomonas tolaasii]NWC38595.1 N-acetylmuramoyl-L-alanine amidase [Pseudomonas tolaasii]